ncbi:MAG: Crp/Fnr family transcriptional regulator [Deltaproteobacteria bacterium]|nr:Crp/Fnr family transcriptional regulator [Deltaproteobacteria bacterium]
MEINLLRNIPLFSGLSSNELKDFLESSERRRYPRGNIVIYQGDTGEVIYLILKGSVKVSLTHPDGKEIILNTLRVGDYFGEMSVFDHMPRSATIVTEEASEFLVISKKVFIELIKRNPEISLKILAEMSKRLREADEQIGSLAHFDVKGRVAKTLTKLSNKPEIQSHDGYIVIPRPSMKDIAAMSGTSRETVSRILNELSKKGILHLTKESIIIFNAQDIHQSMD